MKDMYNKETMKEILDDRAIKDNFIIENYVSELNQLGVKEKNKGEISIEDYHKTTKKKKRRLKFRFEVGKLEFVFYVGLSTVVSIISFFFLIYLAIDVIPSFFSPLLASINITEGKAIYSLILILYILGSIAILVPSPIFTFILTLILVPSLTQKIKDRKSKEIEKKIMESKDITEEEWIILLKRDLRKKDVRLNNLFKNKKICEVNKVNYRVLFNDNSRKIMSNSEVFKIFTLNVIRLSKLTLRDTISYKETKYGFRRNSTKEIDNLIKNICYYASNDRNLENISEFYLSELKRLGVIKEYNLLSKESEKEDLVNDEFLSELFWDLNNNNKIYAQREEVSKLKVNIDEYVDSLMNQYEKFGLKEEEVEQAMLQISNLKESIESLKVFIDDKELDVLLRKLRNLESRMKF